MFSTAVMLQNEDGLAKATFDLEKVSNTVNFSMLIRLDGNGLYQENGRDHIFQLKAGQNRRYFTWPIIAQRIEFVFTSGQNTAFGFQVFNVKGRSIS